MPLIPFIASRLAPVGCVVLSSVAGGAATMLGIAYGISGSHPRLGLLAALCLGPIVFVAK